MLEKRAVHGGHIVFDAARGQCLSRRFEIALRGSLQDDNPFVFTTSSMLLAYQHALDKASKGERNVYILCIDTWNLKTVDGQAVHFISAMSLMRGLNMEAREAYHTGELNDFCDVYLTTSDFLLGPECSVVTLDRLKEVGLFRLFPDQGKYVRKKTPRERKKADAKKRRNGEGLETPVRDLRAYRYKDDKQQDWSSEEISSAAKLALEWQSVLGEVNVAVPMHILAYLLALGSQAPDGRNLKEWINRHTTPNDAPPALPIGPGEVEEIELPENKNFIELFAVLRTRVLSADAASNLDSSIPDDKVERGREAYKAFWEPIAAPRTKKGKAYRAGVKQVRKETWDRRLSLIGGPIVAEVEEEVEEEVEPVHDDLEASETTEAAEQTSELSRATIGSAESEHGTAGLHQEELLLPKNSLSGLMDVEVPQPTGTSDSEDAPPAKRPKLDLATDA